MRHSPRESPDTVARARELRQNASVPERKLWKMLRDCRGMNVKFRRQHAIGLYTADFYCVAAGLVVELDGRSHDRDHDDRRDEYMRALGLEIVRISVSRFEQAPWECAESIVQCAMKRIESRNQSAISPTRE